jgi:hypothetical protein
METVKKAARAHSRYAVLHGPDTLDMSCVLDRPRSVALLQRSRLPSMFDADAVLTLAVDI